MRYDDRLATVLAEADGPGRGQAIRWRQVIDLLAQQTTPEIDGTGLDAFRWLLRTRADIPVAERMVAARAIAGRPIPTELLLFFASDSAPVAAPVIRHARLPAERWLDILPSLGPTARALLRHRDDLPDAVARALGSLGASDLVLTRAGQIAVCGDREAAADVPGELAPAAAVPDGPPPEAAFDDATGQIRHLVERIEAFRQSREEQPRSSRPAALERARAFRWECGADGLLSWTDIERRGAIIGHPLAGDGGSSLGGAGAARAFAARRPFRDAPAYLPALGPVLLSGVPVFTDRDGRFQGYRGTGRPAEEPSAKGRPAANASSPTPPMAVRELVHELRTPLNAIMGFAEMISGEYLGPAASVQRDRAAEIRAQAAQLQQALEDLDLAARGRGAGTEGGPVDLQDVLVDEHRALDGQARARGVDLAFRIEPGLPRAAIGDDAARRLLARLIGGAVAAAEQGSVVRLAMKRDGSDVVMLEASRPPGAPEDDLGARVVRNLVEGVGGTLRAEAGRWIVRLPADRAARPAAMAAAR